MASCAHIYTSISLHLMRHLTPPHITSCTLLHLLPLLLLPYSPLLFPYYPPSTKEGRTVPILPLIVKLFNLVTVYISIFIYKCQQHLLPSVLDNFFINNLSMFMFIMQDLLETKHSYYIQKVRRNFENLGIRFQGLKCS